MPLHISEIGVHIAIGDHAGLGAGAPGEDDGKRGSMTSDEIEALVRACVADALRTLRLQEER